MRILALLIFFLVLFPSSVFAALSLSLEGLPVEIKTDEEFNGSVLLTCSNCSDSYLRGVFFENGSTSYFGYTQNDFGEWVNASNPKTIYFHLLPVESSWSGQLRFKFDPEKTSGNYQFKLIRYTVSGSKSGESSAFAINVLSPTTPTPSPTPTPTPTSTPMPAPLTPTQTTQTFSVTPSRKPTSTPVPPSVPLTITISSTKTPAASSSPTQKWYPDVLGNVSSSTPSSPLQTPTPNLPVNQLNSVGASTFFGVAAAAVGLLSLAFWRLGKLTRPDRLKL